MADGICEHWVGIGQSAFPVRGHEILCQFRKTGDGGQISMAISSEGVPLGDSTADGLFGGVRADVIGVMNRWRLIPAQESALHHQRAIGL